LADYTWETRVGILGMDLAEVNEETSRGDVKVGPHSSPEGAA
jgi:hypothetical protein